MLVDGFSFPTIIWAANSTTILGISRRLDFRILFIKLERKNLDLVAKLDREYWIKQRPRVHWYS